MTAGIKAHVFDHTEHRYRNLAEHSQSLARIDCRYILWRRDDNGTGYGHLLRQRELYVAGPGWHVDDQVVEIVPESLPQ